MDNATAAPLVWVPLDKLTDQFADNLAALRQRQPDLADALAQVTPACNYFLATRGDRVILSRQIPGGPLEPLANPVAAARAAEIAGKLYPKSEYNHPLLIAGLDQGWLWNSVFNLTPVSPGAPGMRPPLYLLAGEVERLWVVLHFQNWTGLLSDRRVHIETGPDAGARLEKWLLDHPCQCMPKLAVTVESAIWSPQGLDSMIGRIGAAVSAQVGEILQRLGRPQPAALPTDRPLRILGITSRYTTFLQYSMRDWLAAMENLGHQTRLVIEGADHEVMPALFYARECERFRPDLILIIDHYRAEMPGIPQGIPCVMWIQDRLPNIYRPEAGAGQGDADYVIGYGRQECTQRWCYPARRFMPSMVGVNEDRFAARPLSESELERFRCDVSFVSHASTPAEEIVEQEAARTDHPEARKLLQGILSRLKAVYDAGGSVTDPSAIEEIITATLRELRLKTEMGPLTDLVTQRINNALLRHQAIRWVAKTGADLRLYGRGWEKNKEFAQFARGVADNQNDLAMIYQASRINLQVTPFGAAHQRLFEGLACGGFFLLRSVTGEAADVVKLQIWNWCRKNGIHDGNEILRRGLSDPEFQRLSSQLAILTGPNCLSAPRWFYAGLEEAALAGFSRAASTLWSDYDAVSFWTQEQLTEKVNYFLKNADARHNLSAAMRQGVLKWHTYTAISRRMLAWIDADMAPAQPLRAAA